MRHAGTFIILAGLVAALGAEGGAQVPSTDKPSVTMRRDSADGTYVFAYGEGADKKEYRFTPATQTDPSVDSAVTHDPQTGRFSYAYTVRNGPSARQQLHSISIPAIRPSGKDAMAPVGWETVPIGATSRVLFYMKAMQPGVKLGVPAGSEQGGITLVSDYLPAPGQAKVVGNVGAPTFAETLPSAVESRIADAMKNDFLVVDILSPTLPSATNEPELTAGVFLARVRTGYTVALMRSKHPQAADLIRALDEAAAELDHPDVDKVAERLTKIRALAAQAGSDKWAKTLASGLTLSLDYIGQRYAARK